MDADPPNGPGAADPSSSVDLTRRAQSGGQAELSQLVERHYDAVVAIVRRRLGAELRRFHDSGDLVQEALVQAVKTFDRYDIETEQDFLRWISVVVENRLRDLSKFHRAQRRGGGAERRVGSIDLPGGSDGKPGEQPGPATQVESGDRDAKVRAALLRLDERTRKLIEARLSETPWADIAPELDFPSDGAARMAYSRALVALSRELESIADEPEQS
ncbi:MAG: RNA polymerase sigma factor [Planctomycetota bacterium]|jgi:RNA polymerase sigma factor (sigma-70 family)